MPMVAGRGHAKKSPIITKARMLFIIIDKQ